MSSNEDAIRHIAHELWEAEGRPTGKADQHWAQAVERAKNTDQAQTTQKRSTDPTEAYGPYEPAQPDQT